MADRKRRIPDLDKALGELEKIVEELESGELPLEKSLQQFEKGVRLSRECQAALEAAEQRVQMLSGGELVDFAGDAPEAADAD